MHFAHFAHSLAGVHRACLMQGTGRLVEDFAAPSHLCPVDLAKLQACIGCELLPRYLAIFAFCESQPSGFDEQAAWLRKAIHALRDATKATAALGPSASPKSADEKAVAGVPWLLEQHKAPPLKVPRLSNRPSSSIGPRTAPSQPSAKPAPAAQVVASARSMQLAEGLIRGSASLPPPPEWIPLNDSVSRDSGFAGGDGAESAYEPLARCWPCFEDLPLPSRADWLHKDEAGEQDRHGQSVRTFEHPIRLARSGIFFCEWGASVGSSRSRSVVYLCPMGKVDGAPPFADLAEVLQATYSLPVRPLPGGLTDAEIANVERKSKGAGYGPQIETPSVHTLLRSRKPADAFCILGYTMEDLCHTAKGMRFLFGQASPYDGCGIFSFARYLDAKTSATAVFRRCAMVLAHEVGHL